MYRDAEETLSLFVKLIPYEKYWKNILSIKNKWVCNIFYDLIYI